MSFTFLDCLHVGLMYVSLKLGAGLLLCSFYFN